MDSSFSSSFARSSAVRLSTSISALLALGGLLAFVLQLLVQGLAALHGDLAALHALVDYAAQLFIAQLRGAHARDKIF
jgi:hypothetical protein